MRPGTQPEHRRHDEAEHQQVAQDRHQPRREQLVEHVHVGGDPGDQPAHGVVVEEGDIQLLEVSHQLPAQVEHGVLAGPLHRVGLDEAGDQRREKHHQEQQGDLRDAAPRDRRRGRVPEGPPRLPGDGARYLSTATLVSSGPRTSKTELISRKTREKVTTALYGPHVRQQAPHQARVVGFAEYLLFHLNQCTACRLLRCRDSWMECWSSTNRRAGRLTMP